MDGAGESNSILISAFYKFRNVYHSEDAIYICSQSRSADNKEHVLRVNVDGVMFSEMGVNGPFRYIKCDGVVIPGITSPTRSEEGER